MKLVHNLLILKQIDIASIFSCVNVCIIKISVEDPQFTNVTSNNSGILSVDKEESFSSMNTNVYSHFADDEDNSESEEDMQYEKEGNEHFAVVRKLKISLILVSDYYI